MTSASSPQENFQQQQPVLLGTRMPLLQAWLVLLVLLQVL
jgi:hypothetical protein